MRSILIPRHLNNNIRSLRSFQTFPRMVHTAATTGYSEQSSQAYEKGRPTYSTNTLKKINDLLQSSSAPKNNLNLLEIGAGTGKFTESFVNYFQTHHPSVSYNLTAVEPSEGFRKTLSEKKLKGVTPIHGTGDAIPTTNQSADAVLIAQAFHWMDNVPTLQEIHRVLQPHGTLFLIWNTYDYHYDWLRIIDTEILTPTYGTVPRQQSGKWRQCFTEESTRRLFTPVQDWYDPYVFKGDRQMILNRFLSTSVIVNLSLDGKEKVSKRINELLDHHPDFKESRQSGVYQIPYVTHIAWVQAK